MLRYDLIVIGSGPAGRRAAVQAAKLKKSVLVVEKGRRVGGVCVHTGTIPSKTLRETVLNLSGWRERGFYGRSYRVKEKISAEDLRERLSITLNHEVEVLEHQFARNSVRCVTGAARFVDAHTIEVIGEAGEHKRFEAGAFIIAVGTAPYRPAGIPFDGESVLDADEILDLKRLPRSLAVIGGSVIGMEYATIFSALDVKVTVIEPNATMLPFIDRELIDEFIHDLRDRGMILRFQSKVKRIERPLGGHLRSASGRWPPSARRHGPVRRRPQRRDRYARSCRLRSRARRARPHRCGPRHLPNRHAAHLRRR